MGFHIIKGLSVAMLQYKPILIKATKKNQPPHPNAKPF